MSMDALTTRRWTATYVNCTWNSHFALVFHDPESDGSQSKAFLDLLTALNIQKKNMVFGSFDGTGAVSRHMWRGALGLTSKFKFTPINSGGKAARSWLPIEPPFGAAKEPDTNSGKFGFQFLLVMTYIALSERK